MGPTEEKLKRLFNTIVESDRNYISKIQLQEFENAFRKYKIEFLKEKYSQKKIVTIDTFFNILVNLLSDEYKHIDNLYTYEKPFEYGISSEMPVTQYENIHLIMNNKGCNVLNLPPTNYIFYLNLFRTKIEAEEDFLYYCPGNDDLLSKEFKSDEEIILPTGTTMKYFAGNNQEKFRNSIILASDFVKEHGIPLALRLK